MIGSSAGGIEALSLLVRTLPLDFPTSQTLGRYTALYCSSQLGEHLIAVIPTGFGNDGAMGAVDVKNAGGTVIIQDPYTARHSSMPMSLLPTAVDFDVPLERIGPLLYDLLTKEKIPSEDEQTKHILNEILLLVSRQANIDL